MAHRLFHFGVEQRLVVAFASFTLDQKLAQILVARQAADMGGQNAVVAEDHDEDSRKGRAFIAQSVRLGSKFGGVLAGKFRRQHNVLRGPTVGSVRPT